ncbi:MAG: hypothetical protein C0613_02490 [Desulfobulbaceae bacterium]|nr:MAG: hypothetical protein C0613_02490 [Desulfobulbaceae bacterium]
MGIAEKKPDTLHSICGKEADRYRPAIATLLRGELPAGWHWVPCSRDAVVAATDAEPVVYYKEFLPRGPLERVKGWLRGSRGQRACRQIDILSDAGLGSPTSLCWGRGRSNEFLLTSGFKGCGFFQFLKRHFSGPLDAGQLRRKRLLLRQAGALIGALHSHGISHGDLRQDNLLVRETEQGFAFCFIDNESNRQWRRLPRARVRTNLEQFFICSDDVLSRSDLLRLYTSYCRVYRRFQGKECRHLFGLVLQRSRRRVLSYLVKQRLASVLPINSADGTGWYDPYTPLGRRIEAGDDLLHWYGQGRFYKKDSAIQVKALAAGHELVVAKRFRRRGLVALLKVWCGLERPPRLWRLSQHFLALGIPIARPMGYLLAGHGLWRRDSYFFSAHAGAKEDLLSLSRKEPQLIGRLAERHLFVHVAFYLARLHNNGYCHGDTKWANIMVDVESAAVLFIDLDGAAHVKQPWHRSIIKDVSRFVVDMLEQGVPAADIRKFIKEYSNMRFANSRQLPEKIMPHISKALARHNRHDIDPYAVRLD